MLTSAIVSADETSSAQLKACLEQSGMVSSVREWNLGKFPDAAEEIPDVVLLDISREPEPFFATAARLRRVRPDMRLIAASSASQPTQQLLIEAMRCGVQDFLSKPIDMARLQETLIRISQQSNAPEISNSNKHIVVMGAKGGVGTTTIAVNLAVQLAHLPKTRTVLLDFARPLGFTQLQLNLSPKFTVRQAAENLNRLDSHFFNGLLTKHSSSLQVLAGYSHPEEWQQVSVAALSRIVNVAKANFDLVITDMGSEYSSEWREVLQLSRMILLVAETNVPALWALERRLISLTGLGLAPERVRVVINRWRHADEETLKSLEKSLKRHVFACLPNDFRRVNDAINSGLALRANGKDSMANKITEIAAQLAGLRTTEQEQHSGFGSLFSKR
jgi:pilus assembly protein CpaE